MAAGLEPDLRLVTPATYLVKRLARDEDLRVGVLAVARPTDDRGIAQRERDVIRPHVRPACDLLERCGPAYERTRSGSSSPLADIRRLLP
jgi:hypothetical protein